MLLDNKYRFSLQFNSDTEENKRAGEFLESLKNKKSTVIVAALNEYLDNHQDENNKIQIEVTSKLSETAIKNLIEKIVNEKLQNICLENGSETVSEEDKRNNIAEDVAEMLGNIDLF